MKKQANVRNGRTITSNKKLSLNVEKIRKLQVVSSDELQQVAGGLTIHSFAIDC